jgi:hypothetical protein
LKVAVRVPGLQRALGRLVGVGVRPEHIQDGAGGRSTLDRRSVKGIAMCVGLVTAVAAIAACIVSSTRKQRHAESGR